MDISLDQLGCYIEPERVIDRYTINDSLEKIAIDVASDIYISIVRKLYGKTPKKSKSEDSKAEIIPESNQDIFNQLLPKRVDTLIPAQAIYELMSYSERK